MAESGHWDGHLLHGGGGLPGHLGAVAGCTLLAPGHHVSCKARPDKARGHQPLRGPPPSLGEHVHMLEDRPPLGNWHLGSEGPSRGVTPKVGPLVDYHLQMQASVAGQQILGLLAGQLITCQLSPPDGPLLWCRDHCYCCRGPRAPIPCHRGRQQPEGAFTLATWVDLGRESSSGGPGKAVGHHVVRSSHVVQVRCELSHVGQVVALAS